MRSFRISNMDQDPRGENSGDFFFNQNQNNRIKEG